MRLSELLNEQSISLTMNARDKEASIKELVQLLESSHGVNTRGEILSKVLQRESMMSTGIGNGVAIPHGKTRLLDHLLAACGVSPAGVDFDTMDGEPATLFILLVSPESLRGPHVKALANVSRLLKEESVRNALRSASTPAQFLQVLKEAEGRYL
ncbi:MAG TPA: PTS sugar transporter subunit IIA [Candidatus Eisenbacteria bacterium]|jgi:mannitol/fructose-specific phosphotransferase system IIA component (Ntr-type)|nr:PTS sugar transporter subunit IIA [Candidatus Eisenbacteria bacterium]